MNNPNNNPWAEINKLNATIAALKADNTSLMLSNKGLLEENQRLRVEVEILRRVADAALADAIVNAAHRRMGSLPLIDQEARLIICEASMSTADALQEAVKEYRKLKEGKVDG